MDHAHYIHPDRPAPGALASGRSSCFARFCTRSLPHGRGWMLALLLLPVMAQAQLTFTTNNGAITITGYSGTPVTVIIPDKTNTFPVETIATAAFLGKTTITSITLSTNLTSIGYQAFGYCSGLTSITIPNTVTNIGAYAFEPGTGLTNVTLSDHLHVISNEVFGECSALATITIPASITNIQTGAFDNCSSLASVYFLGNAPATNKNVFPGVNTAVAKVYYYAGATGWTTNFDGLPTVLLNSPFLISDVLVQNNKFGFTVNGTNGQTVIIEACTNLINASWQKLLTNILSGTSSNFTDAQWENYSRRFYRLYSP
jgi:hypothetical protein